MYRVITPASIKRGYNIMYPLGQGRAVIIMTVENLTINKHITWVGRLKKTSDVCTAALIRMPTNPSKRFLMSPPMVQKQGWTTQNNSALETT